MQMERSVVITRYISATIKNVVMASYVLFLIMEPSFDSSATPIIEASAESLIRVINSLPREGRIMARACGNTINLIVCSMLNPST